MRGLGRKRMIGLQIALIAILSGTTLLASQTQDASLHQKILELEARLKRLEQARGTSAAESGSQAKNRTTPTVDLNELRRQLDVLATEVEKLRSGEPEKELSEEEVKSLGLGESAAAIYRKKQGATIAGYGEMVYDNFDARNEGGAAIGRDTKLDFLRAILYAGYRFDDKWLFNSEIEFEHATTDESGEVSVEFAYVDYLANKNLSFRAGLLLMPMGLTNEFHEPNAFLGTHRSETETRIIPSTWSENGIGVLGSVGKFRYRTYLVSGLDAAGFSADGLRGGRQKGSKAKASDLAFVGRLDFAPTPGVFFGGSVYTGGSDQGQFTLQGKDLAVRTNIGELHGQVQFRGLDLRGLVARSTVSNTRELNEVRNLRGDSVIAKTMQGGYLQVGYNVLSQIEERRRLTPYYRFEKLDTQNEVFREFRADPARNRTFHTLGLEFRPISGIVFKGDYQWSRNRAKTGLNRFSMEVGYAF